MLIQEICFVMESINNSYIEAARVYFKQNEHTTIIIKCALCKIDTLLEWPSFLRHLSVQHSIGLFPQRPNFELDEEIRTEVELELQNLSNVCYSEDENDVYSDEESGENKADAKEADQQDIPDSNEHNVIYKPKQPFYSLLHTSADLMNYFIDQLRQHKYLWSEEYRNMGFKTERSESASQICQALNERFNIFLVPQVVSRSTCTLLSWFKRQYAMYLRNEEYFCRHQAYYDKLLEFVPTKDVCNIDCDVCQRRFYSEDQLRRHKYRDHGGSLPYVCNECQRGFSNASKLRMHQARLHKKPTRWQCNLCTYCAPNKWDLEVHMPVHSGERKYTCELCGVSTKSISSLAVHRRTHSRLKLSCPYCPKEYSENYILKCHIRKNHPNPDI